MLEPSGCQITITFDQVSQLGVGTSPHTSAGTDMGVWNYQETNRALFGSSEFDCDDLLMVTTVSNGAEQGLPRRGRFGTGASCSWTALDTVVVATGSGASIVAGDLISIEVVKAPLLCSSAVETCERGGVFESHQLSTSKKIALQRPSSTIPPTVAITGPQTMGACGAIQLLATAVFCRCAHSCFERVCAVASQPARPLGNLAWSLAVHLAKKDGVSDCDCLE